MLHIRISQRAPRAPPPVAWLRLGPGRRGGWAPARRVVERAFPPQRKAAGACVPGAAPLPPCRRSPSRSRTTRQKG
eukprot:1195269-Prymnesium_polylepis.1